MSSEIDRMTNEEVNEIILNQAVPNALLEQTLKELAELKSIEYDQRRNEAADTLGIRPQRWIRK